MVGHSAMRCGRCWMTMVGSIVVLSLIAGSLSAQTEPDRIKQLLTAGEVGPALAAARHITDPRLRNEQLADIAIAQARLGARRAAMTTLFEMDDDLQRSGALGRLGPMGMGAAGGGAIADFDTLINLITSTIAPDSWSDVGGSGAIEPYPTGVFVDAQGTLHRLARQEDNPLLQSVRAAARIDSGNRAVRQPSVLRKISLTRLEKTLQLRQAFGQGRDEAMTNLAGVYRLKYLFVYPNTGDIVLAGPAGDWQAGADGRPVNVDSGAPVLQLDDLIVMLRNAEANNGKFGCAINPRAENLARAKAYIDRWHGRSIARAQREQWVTDLRDALGKQDIRVWGINPATHCARVIVEADYRMKLVGMGLEDGTLGVTSYLKAARQAGAEAMTGTSVLRWWFAPQYKAVHTTSGHNVFALDGRGVRVMSENELLTETGKRVHTGKADPLTQQFANQFTANYDALAAKYPIYAQLRNLFDLAVLTMLMRTEDLPAQVGWHMPYFRDQQACRVAVAAAPRTVDTVANYIVAERNRFIVGVSGGVSVDSAAVVAKLPPQVDSYGRIEAQHAAAQPPKLSAETWWWD